MVRKYSEEFKAEAVALALSSDKPNAEIARDLGINCKTFATWISIAMNKPKTNAQKPSKPDYQTLERQLRAAQKELELRKKEIDILKKAAVYFASLK